jgi:3-hydroxyisobutyrate dehydrogenase-like beta-hydroxyacid dehydrogenase
MRVAFLGLGQMGFPMAGHLTGHGHDVTVHNRSTAKAALWRAQYGGSIAETAALAVAQADAVCTCLADIEVTREVLLGAGGALARMRPGAILIDHATGTPEFAREIHALAAARGIGFLDAPVTGGVPGATAGTLGIMLGGDSATCSAAMPVLQSYARKISLMGPPGAGHMTKLVNVICGIGMGQAVAEAIAFARRAGLDLERLIEILMAGSSRSYTLEHKGPAMARGSHLPASFTVDLALKNIRQTLEEAARLQAHLPLLAMTEGFYRQIQQRGDGGLDSSSLISLLE